jgi:hypothetical protein
MEQTSPMEEDREKALQELLDARAKLLRQIDILRGGLIYRGGPAGMRLEEVLEDINKRIAELRAKGE